MTSIQTEPYRGIGLNGPLRGELLDNGRSIRLLQPFRVRVFGHVLDVPMGFTTDFASVPRLFWRLCPPWGRYSEAAVVHDWLYRHGRFVRKDADAAFLDLMTRLGVPWWQRTAMYLAVRAFGWLCYGPERTPLQE